MIAFIKQYAILLTIAAVLIVLTITHVAAYKHGKTVADAVCKERQAIAKELGDKVAEAIDERGRLLGTQVEDIISKQRPIIRNIHNQLVTERTIHEVLTNPDCASPDSTVRVRNVARRDPDAGAPATTKPADKMPVTAPSAGGEAAPPR